MAKAETKGAAKEQQNASVDNVVEKLVKGNLVTDIADKAAEEIRQDEEKRKISQVKEIVKCADFLRIKELLNVRKDRAKAKITLDILKKRTELLARLLGKQEDGTAVPDDQKITPNEFRELSRKVDMDQRKMMDDLNNEYEKHDRELRDKYPNSWRYLNYQFDCI
uniref:Uncharacterized protein n=1 Tax=virus sp. ctBM815 TaxID=2825806 RepID=A0A8S5RJV9_9VIRU|nr:MAG TPA: hypothetical protein [virus sp. ctBM815]